MKRREGRENGVKGVGRGDERSGMEYNGVFAFLSRPLELGLIRISTGQWDELQVGQWVFEVRKVLG